MKAKKLDNPDDKTSGILLVNKPVGPTSHDIVESIRERFKFKKVGHAGTLDPFAEGLLVIGINKGTRILEFFKNDTKIYRAKAKLGLMTETFDITGEIREENQCNATKEEIIEAFESFIGTYKQVPPAYSARKYKGKKLYELARQGVIIRLPPKVVEIKWLKIEKVDMEEKIVNFSTEVSAGTYIRSLAMDIGYKLGCGATLVELKRIKSGRFRIEDAVSLENSTDEEIIKSIIPIEKALDFLPAIVIKEDYVEKVLNGVQIYSKNVEKILGTFEKDEYVRIIDGKGRLIAIAISERKKKFVETLIEKGIKERVAKLYKVFGSEGG
jgi:tRNA pseudouridine55 synthase